MILLILWIGCRSSEVKLINESKWAFRSIYLQASLSVKEFLARETCFV